MEWKPYNEEEQVIFERNGKLMEGSYAEAAFYMERLSAN